MKDNNLAIRIRIKDDNFTPTQLPENDAQQELLWFRDLLVLGLVIILVAGGWWAWQYSNDENSSNKHNTSDAEAPANSVAAPVLSPEPDNTTLEIQSPHQNAQVNPAEPVTTIGISTTPKSAVTDAPVDIAAPVNDHAATASDVTSSVATAQLSEAVPPPAPQIPVSHPDAVSEVAETVDTAKAAYTTQTASVTEPTRVAKITKKVAPTSELESLETIETTETTNTTETAETAETESLISEKPQSVPVPPKVQLPDSATLAEITLITPNISAASLSLEMIDYEPGQALPQTVYLEDKALVTVYFFASYQGLQGQSIAHRWLHNGKPVATIQSRIEQARSGAHSSKRINRVMYGAWEVQVLSENGELLAVGRFDVAPPNS